jgi:CRP-like cAMP-binding protein
MRACPNPACPYRRRFGRPAEYEAQAAACSDCGAALVDADELARESAGNPPAEVHLLDEQLRRQRQDLQPLGAPSGEPIELRFAPGGRLLPVLLAFGGVMLLVHALLSHHLEPTTIASFLAGLATLGYGASRLRRTFRAHRQLEPHERGFVYRSGTRQAAVPFAAMSRLRVQHYEVRDRRSLVGYQVELTFEQQGKLFVVGSFARARDEAFERWARQAAEAAS